MDLTLKPDGKCHLKKLGVDERIILKSILENRFVSVWIRIGTKADCYSNRNEPAGFVKFGKFLDYQKKKHKHVLSTIVQMLDVITSFNFNCYSPMMD
jgi:hypothetical protein